MTTAAAGLRATTSPLPVSAGSAAGAGPKPCEFAPIDPAVVAIVDLGTRLSPKVGGTNEEASPLVLSIASLRSDVASPACFAPSLPATPFPEESTAAAAAGAAGTPSPAARMRRPASSVSPSSADSSSSSSAAATPADRAARTPSPATGMRDPASIPEMTIAEWHQCLRKSAFQRPIALPPQTGVLHHGLQVSLRQFQYELHAFDLMKGLENPNVTFDQACQIFTQVDAFLFQMQAGFLLIETVAKVLKNSRQEFFEERAKVLMLEIKGAGSFAQARLSCKQFAQLAVEMNELKLQPDQKLLAMFTSESQNFYKPYVEKLIKDIGVPPVGFNHGCLLCQAADELIAEMSTFGLNTHALTAAFQKNREKLYQDRAIHLVNTIVKTKSIIEVTPIYNELLVHLDKMKALQLNLRPLFDWISPRKFSRSIFLNRVHPTLVASAKQALLAKLL